MKLFYNVVYYNHKNKMPVIEWDKVLTVAGTGSQGPPLTSYDIMAMREVDNLKDFDRRLSILNHQHFISSEEKKLFKSLRELLLHKGGKRCRRTYRKRILNKDMKPMHKTMHKLRHRGRGGGKRRSCKKH